MGETPTFNAGPGKPSTLPPSLVAVFSFLRGSIPDFVNDLAGRAAQLSEPIITDILVLFLQQRLGTTIKAEEFPFCFHHESSESNSGNTARNDFAAFANPKNGIVQAMLPANRVAIVRFEAKRLDRTLDKSRRKEYVLGEYHDAKQKDNTGGIERFKNRTHGGKEQNGALVAYIQTDDHDVWYSKVNQWIESEINQPSDLNLIWNAGDKLKHCKGFTSHHEYESRSARLNAAPIDLYHFWIPLNQSLKDVVG